MIKSPIIAVDFDGTLCKNCWPGIGEPNYKLIDKAVAWCEERGLFFDAVNDNIPESIKECGENCRKVSADIYIDDRSVKPFWF